MILHTMVPGGRTFEQFTESQPFTSGIAVSKLVQPNAIPTARLTQALQTREWYIIPVYPPLSVGT